MCSTYGSATAAYSNAIGDYCDVADLVLEMREYHCHDITTRAKQVAQEIPSAVPEHECERAYLLR